MRLNPFRNSTPFSTVSWHVERCANENELARVLNERAGYIEAVLATGERGYTVVWWEQGR